MFTVEQAARFYRVPLVDYGAHDAGRGRGVLLSSGCGIGMAVMDQLPELRWFCDLDAVHESDGARAVDFAILAHRAASVLALCGWFSLHSPDVFRAILQACPKALAYGGNVDLGHGTLGQFLAAVRARGAKNEVQPQEGRGDL